MNPELRIALYKQMHMIWHDFQLHYLCLMLLANLRNDVLQSFCYAFNEYLTSILRTKYDVILARVVNVPVRFVCSCTHAQQYTAQSHIVSSIHVLPPPKPQIRNASSIPRAKA